MSVWDFTRNLFNSLPVTGGITSALWGDPNQEAMQRGFQQSREELARQRAYQMDSRMNAMGQAASAFGPRNQMLGQMMGMGGPAYDLSQILKNPMTNRQQDEIRDAAFGTTANGSSRNVEFKQLQPTGGTNFNYQDPSGAPYQQPQGAPTRGSYSSYQPFRR